MTMIVGGALFVVHAGHEGKRMRYLITGLIFTELPWLFTNGMIERRLDRCETLHEK